MISLIQLTVVLESSQAVTPFVKKSSDASLHTQNHHAYYGKFYAV